MATLTGNQIKNSYEGILKTLDNLALNLNGKTYFTDGAGNATNLFLTKSTTPTSTNIFGFESDGRPLFALGNTNWSKLTYPMSASGGTTTAARFLDGAGASTGAIYQDRYGSMYYENMYADQGESHVFLSRLASGASTPAKISLNSYNNTNNSNNWFTGYNQSVTNLAVLGNQLTLSRQGTAPLSVTLPDTNTLYDLTSVQAGLNVELNLEGSNATLDQVTLVAGTNITLTDDGSNNITIAASGGSGGAGLVAGTGTSSMKSADTLVATPTQANGNAGIALGSGAKANGEASVAFGEFAEATGTAAAAVGQYAEASALYASAWGRTAYARSEGSVAFGQQAGVQAGFPGAVAMGRQVVGDTADTTHVRALKIVAPDGGLGGNGIIMLSPNGTAYKLTVSDAGALVIAPVIA